MRKIEVGAYKQSFRHIFSETETSPSAFLCSARDRPYMQEFNLQLFFLIPWVNATWYYNILYIILCPYEQLFIVNNESTNVGSRTTSFDYVQNSNSFPCIDDSSKTLFRGNDLYKNPLTISRVKTW